MHGCRIEVPVLLIRYKTITRQDLKSRIYEYEDMVAEILASFKFSGPQPPLMPRAGRNDFRGFP